MGGVGLVWVSFGLAWFGLGWVACGGEVGQGGVGLVWVGVGGI